ncbi:protein-tyrosine phosphatase [Anoxybacillus tengchongensis]|uniref:protein-tyrosine-phosphatase n=1 Tax=Anoxybacillus tengchongensis TaxID=576944 RepID=A0A7X0D9S7_9BACL|nr:low molecular weight protein-tyrosine-phosphatase [Anoxybacillus tengchongensis]MBB6177047.1 protein-tyrosine phosphatase [Anoxybacillus tengchongensis]
MIRVLFVCLGNICRSPMAEAVFRYLVKQEGLDHVISVDSAGTGDWHVGKPPHRGTQRILTEKQIDFTGLKARQISKEDFHTFDYIIGMDSENIAHLRRLVGDQSEAMIARFMDFVPNRRVDDVPDPYFTGNFEEVYELVEEGCKHILERIKRDHSL